MRRGNGDGRRNPWFLRGRLRYLAAAALVVDLGLGVFSTGMAVAAGTSTASTPHPAAAATGTSSAVTVAWTSGRSSMDPQYVDDTTMDPSDPNQPLFKSLKVTVSQTKDLTDQGLEVSWSGGQPTSPGGAASNFLQIMQCWGSKGASGPTPQQCQWGTPNAALASQTGTDAATRDLMTGTEADPKQSLGPAYTHAQYGYPATNTVPFWSVDDPGKKALGWTNDQYNLPPFGAAQSNEVTYARTAADGTGQYIVNLQSALSAPYLGCGSTTYAAKGDTCWLVIVPRGEYDLNGTKASQHDTSLPQNYTYVDGSPLSASVWQDRIQVKLTFSPIGASCQLGAEEVHTAGSELVSGAFSSWQSALCDQGTTFGYSMIGDNEARSAVISGLAGSPAMDFVSSPVDPSTTNGATIDYAPVTSSALVVSYLIDKNYTDDSSNPDIGANGTLVTDLKLTPRLIAKLLTQSYRDDTPGDGQGAYPKGASPVPASNPDSIRDDPEFLALNPEFKYFYPSSAPDGLIVPFGDSDAVKEIWDWVRSDSAARAFLAGAADPWGMRINPSYKDLDLAAANADIDSFPKADPSMYRSGDAPPPGYGTLDMRPYANNLTDGAVRTVTASAGQKTFWDITKVPPQYAGGAAQTPGSRFEMAITTSQAAALYGLPTAALVTDDTGSAGVTATTASVSKELAGASQATAVPGVETIDPAAPVDGGYPLTMRTYAAINVCGADLASLQAYASFLDYAAAAGQVSGTKLGDLPLGYTPLSAADRAETRTTASALRAEVTKPQCASHKSSGSTAPGTPPGGPGSPSGPGGSTTPASTTTTGSTSTSSTSTDLPGSTSADVPPGSAPGSSTTPPTTTPSTASSSSTAVAGDAPPGGITPAAYLSPAKRYALLAALCFALPCLILGPRLLVMTRRKP